MVFMRCIVSDVERRDSASTIQPSFWPEVIVVGAVAVLICRVFRKTDTISVDIWMEVSDSQLDSGGLAGEKAQGVKTLAAKPDDQSVVPEPSW